MAKDRKPTYRSQFDGHRRLAAAVILQAIKDMSSAPTNQDRETASEFLESDMWPFSDVLDLPMDGQSLRDYLQNIDELSSEISRQYTSRPERTLSRDSSPLRAYCAPL